MGVQASTAPTNQAEARQGASINTRIQSKTHAEEAVERADSIPGPLGGVVSSRSASVDSIGPQRSRARRCECDLLLLYRPD